MCRSVFAAGLAICVSLSNYYPQLLAAEWHLAHPGTSLVRSKCCCGTKQGKCCGKACCQSPAKSSDTPVEPIRSNYRGVPLAVAEGEHHSPVDSNGTGLLANASLLGSSISGSTLFELSIRINT